MKAKKAQADAGRSRAGSRQNKKRQTPSGRTANVPLKSHKAPRGKSSPPVPGGSARGREPKRGAIQHPASSIQHRKPRPASARQGKEETDWHPIFLAAFRAVPYVTHAAKKANVTPQTAYNHRARYPHFAKGWDEALAEGSLHLPDILEATAYDRAVNGIEVPIYDKDGNLVDTRRDYSDRLLIALLKGNAPKKFSDKLELNPTSTFVPLDELARRVSEAEK